MQIIILYFVGTLVGAFAGYVLGYLVQPWFSVRIRAGPMNSQENFRIWNLLRATRNAVLPRYYLEKYV